MSQSQSPRLLEAQAHVTAVQQEISAAYEAGNKRRQMLEAKYRQTGQDDKIAIHTLLEYIERRAQELSVLLPSPYVARCDIRQQEGKEMRVYVGKCSFQEANIVSWVSPIATVRFSEIGETSYKTAQKETKQVTLLRKDDYAIRDGKIVFFATETSTVARTLIYQEHFSHRKTGFILPDIIARMEKAQDTVIRAAYKGPLLISGPAGSGKTTLALHRVAYLMQAPETTELFPGHRIRVFVQDQRTKSYFSTLLPDLGITQVEITTFFDWACTILDLQGYEPYIAQSNEFVEDAIRLEKLRLLRSTQPVLVGNPIAWLVQFYKKTVQQNQDLILQRITNKQLDDIDSTLLLLAYKKQQGKLLETKEYLVQQKNFSITRKQGKFPVSNALCVVDEFQNYLPEQLQLIRGTLSPDTNAIMYVGDKKQQTRFGTIRSWSEIGESLSEQRSVVLEKVYRNTQEMLRFISSLGYELDIPTELPQGEPVQILENTAETQQFIHRFVQEHTDRLIGILAKQPKDLLPYGLVQSLPHVKVLSIQEAQGVEFDTVFFVGNNADTWQINSALDSHYREEKKRIQRDVLYVALTRAMRELYIVGNIILP